MKIRIVLIFTSVLAILGAVYAFKMVQNKKAMAAMASMAPQPPTVAVMPATLEKWTGELSAVASLQSSESIMVSSELAGTVRTLAFASGAEVKEGQLLVELDCSAEQAQLEGYEATARLAALSLQRAKDLRAKGTDSQADLDAAEASYGQAQAAVNQVKAVIAKKRITAPFSGKLGIRLVSIGEYLAAGTGIVMLENARPLYADFGLPQNDISKLKPGLAVSLTTDAHPGKVFTGLIEAINPRVSDSTRTVGVRAVFENADLLLAGGMFANVSVRLENSSEVVVVPAASLVYSSYGNFVYVMEPGPQGTGKVIQQFVTLGDKRGDQVAVLKGLKPGDQVVTAGQLKLRHGVPVKINNTVQPDNNPKPTPAES